MDNQSELIRQLKNHIGNSEIEQAIDLFDENISLFPITIKNDWILLRSQYFRTKKRYLSGIERTEELQHEDNRWVKDFLSFLEILENQHLNQFSSKTARKKSKRILRRKESTLRVVIAITDELVKEKVLIQEVFEAVFSNYYVNEQGQSLAFSLNFLSDRAKNANLSPSAADLFILVLWRDFGPDTGDASAEDGFVEMYKQVAEHLRKQQDLPLILAYQCNRDLIIRPSDPDIFERIEQLKKVEAFFSKIKSDALSNFRKYETLEDFTLFLEMDIEDAIEEIDAFYYTQLQASKKTNEAQIISDEGIEEIKNAYLDWLIDQHSELELRGIGGDSGLSKIPLEKVYVALKGYRSSNYEIEQSMHLHKEEMFRELFSQIDHELTALDWAGLMQHAERLAVRNNPVMLSMNETHREKLNEPNKKDGEKMETITLADAFRRERWLVILGDPGSGKTTLARWIILKLARALREGETNVWVPTFQVNPELENDNNQKVDLGPARLPILLRISEFAEAYVQARKKIETLSIVDFLGRHSWLGQSPGIDPKKLNLLFRQELSRGNAVIILDGMDEITVDSQRDEMVIAIETLIDKWINAQGRQISKYEISMLKKRMFTGEPAKEGGNQIIITSRIAGYQRKHIAGEVTHVTIKPMGEIAVGHFCDAWTLAAQQQSHPGLSQEENLQIAKAEAAALKKEIFRNKNLGVRELATNPLMVTILALVYRKNKGRLPAQRSQLYELALNILVKEWRITGIQSSEIEYVLSPLAAFIHENYATGLIEESELRELISRELAEYRKLDPDDLPPDFPDLIDDFIEKVKKDVGILAERSEQLYGFLHLTFQEYLTALHLVRSSNKAAEAILEKLDDPRWREPILLALGYISTNKNWGPEKRKEVLQALLDADSRVGNFLPRSALLISNALLEMAKIPENIIKEVCQRLLYAYTHQASIGYDYLAKQVEKGLEHVFNGNQKAMEETFEEALLTASEKPDLAIAVGKIISAQKWFSTSGNIRQALISALPFDDPEEDFPLHEAVFALLKPTYAEKRPQYPKGALITAEEELVEIEKKIELIEAENEEIYEAKRFQLQENIRGIEAKIAQLKIDYETKLKKFLENHLPPGARLPLANERLLPFRFALEHEPVLLEFIHQNPDWSLLIGMLYGGFHDEGLGLICQANTEISSTLALEEGKKERHLLKLRERKYWNPEWESNDEVFYNMAVYLDFVSNGWSKAAGNPEAIKLEINPAFIFDETPLTPQILKLLREKKPAGQLLPLLSSFLTEGGEAKKFALLAGLLLAPTLYLPHFEHNVLAEDGLKTAFSNLLKKRSKELQGVVQILTQRDYGQHILTSNLRLFAEKKDEVLHFIFKTLCASGVPPQRFGDLFAENNVLAAEQWSLWFSGYSDDAQYKFAVVLDVVGKKIDALAIVPYLHQSVMARFEFFSKWNLQSIPPNYMALPDSEWFVDLCTIATRIDFLHFDGLAHEGLLLYNRVARQKELWQSLRLDLLATCLLLPQSIREPIVGQLGLPNEVVESEFELFRFIASGAKELDDPVRKSAVLWRLLQYQGAYFWSDFDLWEEAYQVARKIANPLLKFRALERLLWEANPFQKPKIYKLTRKTLLTLEDPDNRARGLARLSVALTTQAAKMQAWQEVLEHLLSIATEADRVRAFLDVLPVFSEKEIQKKYQTQVLETLSDQWEIRRLQGLESLSMLPLLQTSNDFTPLLIYGICNHLRGYLGAFSEEINLWAGLLSGENPAGEVARLIKLATDKGTEGLTLSPGAISVIDTHLERRSTAILEPILPYVFSKSQLDNSTLNRWFNSDDQLLRAYAALMLAEAGEINAEIVRLLGQQLLSGGDMLRFRISLVFHGTTVYIGNAGAKFRASRLGLESLLAIAEIVENLRGVHEGKRNILRWASMNIIFDSNEILQQLAAMVENENERSHLAAYTIGSISATFFNVSEAYYGLFFSPNLLVRQKICLAHVRCYNTQSSVGVPQVLKEEHNNYLEMVTPEVEAITQRVAAPRHSALKNCMLNTLEQRDNNETSIASLTQNVHQQILNNLVTGDPEAIVYHVPKDEERANQEASILADSLDSLELLFALLENALKYPLDEPWHAFYCSTILEIAAATTQYAPATVINLLSKYRLTDLLFSAALNQEWAVARASAVRLIAFLENLPKDMSFLLKHAFEDVGDVQDAAIFMTQNIRYIDQRFISQLISMLKEKDASLIYAAGKMLSLIGRNEKTSRANRQMIINALSAALQAENVHRGVFSISNYGRDKNIFYAIKFHGRLDQNLYQVIAEITGLI